TSGDSVLSEVLPKLAELEDQRPLLDAQEYGRKFWSILRVIYVTNPADVDKINWGRTLPNELNFMSYWKQDLLPSIQKLKLTAQSAVAVNAPVLIIHGTKDRSAPYGGGRDWAALLPNARLISIENGGHAPWIEGPELVFDSINTFLRGAWPK